MKSEKFSFSALIIIFILLATIIVPTHAWASAYPAGSPDAAFGRGTPMGSQILIADQAIDTEDPVVVYNSQQQEYLVVWWNDRPGNDDIYGQRVSKTGLLIGPWFAVAYGTGYNRRNPHVAYNSQQNEYLVVWEQTNGTTGDYVGVYGQRLSGTGLPLGGVLDIAVSTSSIWYFISAAAYDPTYDKYLVTYTSFVTATYIHAVLGQALNSNGSTWGASFEIAPNLGPVGRLDLAYNPLRNEFLVTWDQTSSQSDVMVRRVKMAAGADVLGSILTISSDTTNDDSTPHVAAVSRPPDGQYLIVWDHCKNSPGCSQSDIRAQLVSGTGNLEGGTIMFPSPTNNYESDVAGCENSNAYFATWMQEKSVGTGGIILGDIAGRFVNGEGVIQPDFWLGGDSAVIPSVTCGSQGDYLVVYMKYSTATSTFDIWGRLVGNRLYLPLVLR